MCGLHKESDLTIGPAMHFGWT